MEGRITKHWAFYFGWVSHGFYFLVEEKYSLMGKKIYTYLHVLLM